MRKRDSTLTRLSRNRQSEALIPYCGFAMSGVLLVLSFSKTISETRQRISPQRGEKELSRVSEANPRIEEVQRWHPGRGCRTPATCRDTFVYCIIPVVRFVSPRPGSRHRAKVPRLHRGAVGQVACRGLSPSHMPAHGFRHSRGSAPMPRLIHVGRSSLL